jgi:hypothetical protein
MVPFGKQQEIFCAIFRRQVQKSCQETAGRLFIEGGVVVITNEMSASVDLTDEGSKARPTAAFMWRLQ